MELFYYKCDDFFCTDLPSHFSECHQQFLRISVICKIQINFLICLSYSFYFSYLNKFTEFLRLFVSIHLRRFENSSHFPVLELLMLLFKYTFKQVSKRIEHSFCVILFPYLCFGIKLNLSCYESLICL